MDRPAQPARAPRDRRRRFLLGLLAALSVATAGAGSLSLAVFTDQSTASGGFTTGTVDVATSPATLFSVAGMLPGDSVTAPLTVQNGGTAELRYAMTTSATNPDGKALRSQLQLEVRTEGSGCSAFDGAVLYGPGILNGASFGDPAAGGQAGDRTLAAGTAEVLCFRVSLPLSAGNGVQNATTTATFTFSAEQTANNP